MNDILQQLRSRLLGTALIRSWLTEPLYLYPFRSELWRIELLSSHTSDLEAKQAGAITM